MRISSMAAAAAAVVILSVPAGAQAPPSDPAPAGAAAPASPPASPPAVTSPPAAASAPAAPAQAPAPARAPPQIAAAGIWENPENKSQIEIYACGEDLCGKIVKITDAQSADGRNPKAELRSRPIIGLVVISAAKRTAAGQWKGGLYNRTDGLTYSGTLALKSPSALDVQGCSAGGHCRTVTWTRVK